MINESKIIWFTHLLKCRHCVGTRCKTYYMRCNILKTMPDGRLKVEVIGERYWKDRLEKSKVRYVQAFTVIEKPKESN